MSRPEYDVLVIGAGHAGAEAAWAAANLGARTALLSFRLDAVGRMSCNPAIGGIGKGQMVREIDALGGLMGMVADETGIQFKMLNRSKGPAVWSPRCQSDREAYAVALRRRLELCPNLVLIEAGVDALDTQPQGHADGAAHVVCGVRLSDGRRLAASAVVVTAGTFLAALMHCGEKQTPGGRIGEAAAAGLSASLRSLGLELGRLKTGTPPRLQRDTIDFSRCERQTGDEPATPFSFLTERITQSQVDCWITYTDAGIHDVIRANLHRAPMYSGQIAARGPRYCPSIEDKVVRFADKERHQLFLEPEGRDSERIYVNGISTSLPEDVQREIVRRVPGLERARILQFGYAVEYDFVPPEQTHASLMSKRVAGLFLAGQINGTSGYEEAAGQGLLAGINATRFTCGRPPVILRRDQAYIGVMIDDLVTRGVSEPYRMFTSRAEHRLLLRYDNADERLTPLGREIGLVDEARWARFERRRRELRSLRQAAVAARIDGLPLLDWLKRGNDDWRRACDHSACLAAFARRDDLWAQLLVDAKYEGYITRQRELVERSMSMESQAIPSHFDYQTIRHLRREALERWLHVRPATVGQAARVSGIHPTDVSLLLLELGRQGLRVGHFAGSHPD